MNQSTTGLNELKFQLYTYLRNSIFNRNKSDISHSVGVPRPVSNVRSGGPTAFKYQGHLHEPGLGQVLQAVDGGLYPNCVLPFMISYRQTALLPQATSL